MHKLLNTMATDMGITPYDNEPEQSYAYRIMYSALGLWCLNSALGDSGEKDGISKTAQSILLHRLLNKYMALCPSVRDMFKGPKNDFAVFIRAIYEQTGYLLTLDNNYNILNHGGQTIHTGEEDWIYFGIPDGQFRVDGLGIHINQGKNETFLYDFLIRDNLTPDEYISANFNECDFIKRDIELSELEFFDTRSAKPISKSWSKRMPSDITMARKDVMGPYYRLMFNDKNEPVLAEEKQFDDSDLMTGAEFRRIYAALRYYHRTPMQMLICPIDDKYTHISILGQIPNREYFYLLLTGWPKRNIGDRNNFIVRNELVPRCVEIMENLGFKIREGEFYG